MPYYKMPDQQNLYVRQIGQGKPVLVLSGLGMSSWQWLPFLAPHLKKYHFIIPDFRGFGGSKHCSIPTHQHAIEQHWEDIQSLIQQLKLDTFDVIGYSMGATTTMHGLKYGDFAQHITRYLHIDQSSKIKNDATWSFGLFGSQQENVLQLMQNMLNLLSPYQEIQILANLPKKQLKQLYQLWLEFLELQKPNAKLNILLRYFSNIPIFIRLLPLNSIPYICWYLRSYLIHNEDYRESLIQMKQPVHFVIGQQSSLYPAQGQIEIAQQLPQSQLHILQHSGHVPLTSEPIQFAKILKHFLQS